MGQFPGVTSAIPSLVPSLVPGSIPTLPGQLGTGLPTIPTIDTIGAPSECLLLKNMFDPKNEVINVLIYVLIYVTYCFLAYI